MEILNNWLCTDFYGWTVCDCVWDEKVVINVNGSNIC
jgi:hypothetical protein